MLGLYRISAPALAGIRHLFQIRAEIRLRQKSHQSRIVFRILKVNFSQTLDNLEL